MVMRGPTGAEGLLGIRSVEIWSVSVWMPGALQVSHLSSGKGHDVTACPVRDGAVAEVWPVGGSVTSYTPTRGCGVFKPIIAVILL